MTKGYISFIKLMRSAMGVVVGISTKFNFRLDNYKLTEV